MIARFVRGFVRALLGLTRRSRQVPRQSVGRVKFVEGTEWTCPECGKTLAFAKHDIRAGDVVLSSAWDVREEGFWSFRHCGVPARRMDNGVTQLHTPTGWVG